MLPEDGKMQTTPTRLSVPATGIGQLSVMDLVRQYFADQHARAAERRSLLALHRLDERLLRDVGLTRADLRDTTEV
jgi:uncharacterized protein YjiS (DUF1127 family)